MDTKQLERFCPWARRELIDAVERRCVLFGLDDKSRPQVGPDADIVNGTVLTQAQKAQRSSLYSRIEFMGYEAFCEAEAYGWFNRFAAIRYMELHGFLPSRVRMLSGVDGSFDPQCLRAVGELDLPGLDVPATLQLIVQNQADEAYRDILVAQCNELADCLPEVFGRVGGSDALTLPDGLLLRGEHDYLYHLVTDIPESDWQDVEVLGWMYQFYNSERKEDFFKSKRKAEAADIAPATQLFTPEWIVRYMVENSLGRLWMLNHPESSLRSRMEYYVEPDAEHEDFIRVASPEEITLCDPACGSGHILSYAFELLFAIYEECGYTAREIPELILTKNLSGYEVDPRAAQIASLVLALRAREHDRRFFRREVRADVRMLESVPLEEGEAGVPKELAEELSHLGEVGSLLAPTDADVEALHAGIASCEGELFAAATKDRLERALEACEALRRRFYVVVANPPYMGSSSFNAFMSGWVKRNYPDVKSDLFSSFIVRIMAFANPHGEVGIMCPFVWMFIGSYEKLRNLLIDEKTLTSLIQLEYSGFSGATVPICTFTFHNSKIESYKGGYIRLSDFVGANVQAPKALEAIKNPTCGWFYRRDASTFHQIPGFPIAYWASDALLEAFEDNPSLEQLAKPRQGLATGNNNMFLREWWEVSGHSLSLHASPEDRGRGGNAKWYPCKKGGGYRRWYGFNSVVIDWERDGTRLKQYQGSVIRNPNYYFREGMSWGTISSAKLSMRYAPAGSISEHAGSMIYIDRDNPIFSLVLAAMNSSAVEKMLTFLSPSLRFTEGPVGQVPIPKAEAANPEIAPRVDSAIELSRTDYDSLETSWDFKRNPLV